MRFPPNSPFSHIQIVPKISPERSVTEGRTITPIVFQSPSYSQQAEQRMATPFNLQAFSSTASLANNTTGTTFAAKARAAELNAVRSRKAAKEMEAEDEVPSVAPVALGAIKFTKPRNRGRAWKALNLEELPEESLQEEEEESDRTVSVERHKPQVGQDADYRSDDVVAQNLTYENLVESQMRYGPKFPLPSAHEEPMVVSQPQKQEKMPVSYNLSVWDQSASPARTTGQERYHQVSSGHLTPQPPSRGSPALSQQGFLQMPDAWSQGKSTPSFPSAQATKRPEIDADNRASQGRLSSLEESKLQKLGVLPALQHQQAASYPTGRNNHDDPFTGPSQAMQSHAPHPYTADQFFTAGLRSAGRPAPPAVKGTLNQEFHFSQTLPSNMSKANPYPRDPMPYSSFSASSKKDLLLRNLHEVVESSKTQGTLPNSTRTVLYDPVAHDSGKSAQPSPTEVAFKRAQVAASSNASTTGSRVVSRSDKELLKVSDPLPWTDRPVSIHNSTSPLAPQFPTLTVMPTNQTTPPGLSFSNPDIWSLAQRNPPTRPALENVDVWWNDVHRREEFRRAIDTPVTRGGSRNANPLDTPVHSAQRRVHDRSSGVENSLLNSLSRRPSDGEVVSSLMLPALRTLMSYVDDASPGHFRRFARVPEWCIDKSAGGNQSFFGDWGVPPSRVGRDPRYRPTFHEGRYTVFEELDRRGLRDGLGRKYA